MTEKLRDIVIGQGIAAHAFLWTYAQKIKQGHLDQARSVFWIKSPIIPTCSLTSTSLVSCAGLQYGVSDLGDKLLKSYELFVHLFSNFSGVETAKQKHLAHGDLDNFKKRYGDAPDSCFVIASHIFLRELENQFTKILSDRLVIKTDTFIEARDNFASLQSGDILPFHRCYLALGAGNVLLGRIDRTRAVAGQYAHAKACLGDQSWVISKGPHNLIYRASDQTLLVGSLDDKDDELGWPCVAPKANQLKDILNIFEMNLPINLTWKVEAGVRHKGQKRQPFWGSVGANLYSVHGLYKNGYSLAFLAAKDLLT